MTRRASPGGSALGPCANCGKNHRLLTLEQCQDRSMTERKLQDSVVGRAKRRGWTVAHAGRGWVGGSEEEGGQWVTPMAPGWPDLTLAKAGNRLIFMELKREQGDVAPEQWFWLKLLNLCGARAILVRPSDVREGRVNAILSQGSPI